MSRRVPLLVLAAIVTSPALAWAQAKAPARIRDNLFLLEEAYNQEPGVIQHIFLHQYSPESGEFAHSFTEEWPVPTDLHQLSVTINWLSIDKEEFAGLNDMLVNYRLQALGLGGQSPIAMAPRLSLVLPTGDPEEGTGRGVIGLQLNIPLSLELGPHFVAHLNAGATFSPGAQSPGGRTDTAVDANAGGALVWQPLAWVNPLVEVVYTVTEDVADVSSDQVPSLVVNPGIRFAVDHERTGLQVVPGASVPLQVLPEGEFEAAALAYLSFEHPAF